MNQLHEPLDHDPLDVLVGDALRADAARSPRVPQDWSSPIWAATDMRRVPPVAPGRTSRLAVVLGVAAATVLVIGLALVVRPDGTTTAPASVASAWMPSGTEFPLTDLGPATEVFNGLAVEALTRQVGVEGHPPQVIATTIGYWATATAVVSVCTSENGSSGCRPDSYPISWSTSVTSSVDNGFADYDLWTVEGLPAAAAFVSYVDGDQQLWQRPVAGFSAFPNMPGSDEVVIAYDAAGSELARFGAAEAQAVSALVVAPPQADISRAQFDELTDLTRTTMETCLVEVGGTVGVGNVVTFADDVDQIAVWDQCVASVQADVAAAVTAIDPRFYDPSTERPEVSDPPFTFSD